VDDVTVQAARSGDRSAQARLLRWLQDPWYRLCLSLLGDVERAREATQEAAVRFLRQLPLFRGDSTIKTWALGTFNGDYRSFHARIRAAMPPTQSPNLYLLGKAATFVKQVPFSV